MTQETVVVDRRAGRVARIGAYVLDLFLMSPLFAVALVMMGYTQQDLQTSSEFDQLTDRLREDADTLRIVFLALLVVFFIYRVASQFTFGRTVGKAATGILVAAAETEESPTLDRLIIRELIVVFAIVVPFAGIFVFFGDGVSMFTNGQGRTWHDRAAGTQVLSN